MTNKRRVQLQAKSDAQTKITSFALDKKTEGDIEFINEFIETALNIRPSLAVVIRRSLRLYFWHLVHLFSQIKKSKADNGDLDLESIEGIMNVLDMEREDLYKAAGKEFKRNE